MASGGRVGAGVSERSRVVISQLLLVVALIAVWLWASREGGVSPILLPRPMAVVQRIPEILVMPETWAHIRLTALSILAAFCVSLVSGLTIGFISGRKRRRALMIEPVLNWFQTIPIILLYPVMVLLFGLGPLSKIVFAGLYGFFPIAFSMSRAFSTVDARYIRAATSMGATERQMLSHVLIPAALPMVMSGVRIGAALNLIGVLAGEILASRGGLGYQIATMAQTFRIPDLYAFIFIALVMVVTFNLVVTRTEDRSTVR